MAEDSGSAPTCAIWRAYWDKYGNAEVSGEGWPATGVDDIDSIAFDVNGKQQPPRKAKKVLTSKAGYFLAELGYGQGGWKNVQVRVRCSGGKTSPPHEVWSKYVSVTKAPADDLAADPWKPAAGTLLLIELIDKLVERGVLSPGDRKELLATSGQNLHDPDLLLQRIISNNGGS